MLTKIDWLTFTQFRECPDSQNPALAWELVVDTLKGWLGSDYRYIVPEGPAEVITARAPYSVGWKHTESGIVILYHPRLSHFCVELSGRACDWLFARVPYKLVLSTVAGRLTRLDIACDIATDTRPVVFEAQRDKGRFSARSEIISDSGESVYVGSRKSDRFARVYRYNEPHERAALLRVEYVLKADYAKATGDAIVQSGLDAVTKALGGDFGWCHPDWDVNTPETAEIAVYRPERKAGKTLYWLSNTVAPLLVRLAHEEGFDVGRWFVDEVVDKLADLDDN